jgi:hypothetical protein
MIQLNFTIPQTTPPGKYLVRVEHFNISPDYNGTQMYVNCAQVDVSGPGGGISCDHPSQYDQTLISYIRHSRSHNQIPGRL